MEKTGIVYDAATVSMLTGIQNDGLHTYELVKISFSDLDSRVQENYKALKDGFKDDPSVQYMINRLKLGGSLPPIIINPDNMNILDGCHRTWAYYFTNTVHFYGLLKQELNKM